MATKKMDYGDPSNGWSPWDVDEWHFMPCVDVLCAVFGEGINWVWKVDDEKRHVFRPKSGRIFMSPWEAAEDCEQFLARKDKRKRDKEKREK